MSIIVRSSTDRRRPPYRYSFPACENLWFSGDRSCGDCQTHGCQHHRPMKETR